MPVQERGWLSRLSLRVARRPISTSTPASRSMAKPLPSTSGLGSLIDGHHSLDARSATDDPVGSRAECGQLMSARLEVDVQRRASRGIVSGVGRWRQGLGVRTDPRARWYPRSRPPCSSRTRTTSDPRIGACQPPSAERGRVARACEPSIPAPAVPTDCSLLRLGLPLIAQQSFQELRRHQIPVGRRWPRRLRRNGSAGRVLRWMPRATPPLAVPSSFVRDDTGQFGGAREFPGL